ncbi:MAG TPA: NADH-quinone oxidoreductase subunit NuoB [Candidatus Acidoferrales bacterium]|nr:NADH-quinone oxidoreductase subunit NuoB [Candidatus Acidoferrales bacterium]
MDEQVAPYSVEAFMNAEKDMNKLLEQSAMRYKTPVNAVFAKLSDLTKLTMKDLIKWGRTNSVWPMQFGLACCAMELLDFGSARLDAERKGYLLFRGTPRQTDVMIVAGWVTKSMVPRVKRMYEQMAKPNYVISYGECATSGGPWWESYNIIQGIDQVLPVDVYVAGCPPKPENLFSALIKLQEKISGKTAGNTAQSISEDIRRTEDSRL